MFLHTYSYVVPKIIYFMNMHVTGAIVIIDNTSKHATLINISMYYLHTYIYSNRNINTGHGVNHSTDESFAVQTPAVNFTIIANETVSISFPFVYAYIHVLLYNLINHHVLCT